MDDSLKVKSPNKVVVPSFGHTWIASIKDELSDVGIASNLL